MEKTDLDGKKQVWLENAAQGVLNANVNVNDVYRKHQN